MAVTSVDSSDSSVLLLAPNSARKGFIVANTDDSDFYVLMASGTASATNYSFIVASGDEKAPPPGYTGEVNGVWATAATGAAIVTEY